MTLNIDLEDVPDAILEAVKARIMANRRRLLDREELLRQPPLQPKPQFRKFGADSKTWKRPQPAAVASGGSGWLLAPTQDWDQYRIKMLAINRQELYGLGVRKYGFDPVMFRGVDESDSWKLLDFIPGGGPNGTNALEVKRNTTGDDPDPLWDEEGYNLGYLYTHSVKTGPYYAMASKSGLNPYAYVTQKGSTIGLSTLPGPDFQNVGARINVFYDYQSGDYDEAADLEYLYTGRQLASSTFEFMLRIGKGAFIQGQDRSYNYFFIDIARPEVVQANTLLTGYQFSPLVQLSWFRGTSQNNSTSWLFEPRFAVYSGSQPVGTQGLNLFSYSGAENQWVHVAIVLSGGRIYTYFGGALKSDQPIPDPLIAESPSVFLGTGFEFSGLRQTLDGDTVSTDGGQCAIHGYRFTPGRALYRGPSFTPPTSITRLA